MAGKAEHGPGKWTYGYVKFIQRRAIFVLLFWIALFICGAIFGFNLLSEVQLSVGAPKGTQGYDALQELRTDFVNQANDMPMIYLLHAKSEKPEDKTLLSAENLKNKFIYNLNQSISNHCESHPKHCYVNTSVSTTYLASKQENISLPCVFPLNKLFNCSHGRLDTSIVPPQPVINLHPETEAYWAFVSVAVEIPDAKIDNDAKIFTQFMIDAQYDVMAQAFNGSDAGKVEMWITGFPILTNEVSAGIEKNMLQMDVTALPLAMITLAYILSSVRLLIIPIASIVVSVLVAFLVVWQVALVVPVISFAPSMMMSVMLAMSVDYSLFLLSRYRQELLRGRPTVDAVAYMVFYAGHTVIVSGSTLILCFLSLMFFPVVMFQSMGYASAISLMITLFVNLTLTPTLLLLFSNFFERAILPSGIMTWIAKTCCCHKPSADHDRRSRQNIYEDERVNSTSINKLLTGEENGFDYDKTEHESSHVELETELRNLSKTKWYQFITSVQRYPKLVIFILLGMAAPCAWRAQSFATTVNILSLVPRGSEGTLGYQHLGTQYGSGSVAPYYLITKTTDGDVASLYNLTQSILNELPRRRVIVENATLETLMEFCLGFPEEYLCPSLMKVNATAVDQPKRIDALLTTIFMLDDPYAGVGIDWYPKAIAVMEKHVEQHPGSEAYISGAAGAFIDAVKGVYSLYTTIIGATAAFVMIWIGAAFRSFLIPLRAVITIGCTICYVYALAVWTYEYGIFDWLRFDGMAPTIEDGESHGAIYWMVPIMTFSILVGLGLDYDVFLISRIVEYRKAGVNSRDSIICGTAMTGGIITAAGMIMAIAFGGLLFCSESVLNELSFFLLLAVCIDTMVIRTMLVPAIMTLLGEANWWPMKVPTPTISVKHARRLPQQILDHPNPI